MNSIKFKKVRDVKTPERIFKNDAGLDMFTPSIDGYNIEPGLSIKIPSGIIFDIPEGYAGVFLNKSSIANGLNLVIGAQVIDSGYIGEVHICLHNIGKDMVYLGPDIRVAQIVFIPVYTPALIEVLEMTETERGDNGFGSTGGGSINELS